MKFKHEYLAAQFASELEPDLQRLLLDFEDASKRFELPEPLLTCFGRTVEENKAVNGVPNSLHLWELMNGGKRRARAADVSIRPYDAEQLKVVATWFRGEVAKRGRPRWEFLLHDVGSGMHLHVARRRTP